MSVTPRRTRLLRVPDLQAFQRTLAVAALGVPADWARHTAVVVPTAAAAAELVQTIEELVLVEGWRPQAADLEAADAAAFPAGDAIVMPHVVTRSGFYELLTSRLAVRPRVLDRLEREVLFERAAAAAAAAGAKAPFSVRPALLAEMQAFYDAVARHGRSIDDFERLVGTPLEAGSAIDRGARRLLEQTRFLAATFREYEGALGGADALDEHTLRRLLRREPARTPLRRIVLSIGDQAVSASGLYRADYDLLMQLPRLESLLVVATEAVLASGYLGRLLDTLPEIEVHAAAPSGSSVPALLAPAEPGGALYFTSRDREDELVALARGVREHSGTTAFVYQRPLPYLALARQVLDAHGVAWQAVDAQPLAAEPYAAAVDLVLTSIATAHARGTSLALLRTPHFRIDAGGGPVTRQEIAACNRELREAFFFGGRDRLLELRERWRNEVTGSETDGSKEGTGRRDRASRARERRRLALRALEAVVFVAERLEPLESDRPAVEHLDALEAFLREVEAPPPPGEAGERWLRARAAVFAQLQGLRAAFARFGDRPRPFGELAALLRRLLEEHTFSPRIGPGALHLVDAEAAPYGRFAHATLGGLVEGEWPGGGGRAIFYPSGLLRDLGWPAESDRRLAGRAAFDDLLRLPHTSVAISTFTLDDESIVRPAPLIEDLERAALTVVRRDRPAPGAGAALAVAPLAPVAADERGAWQAFRSARARYDPARFRGAAGAVPARAYAVTAIDKYLQCPFKYFAAQVLALEEEPDDRPGLSVQERGQFVHDVFREFFARWEQGRRGTVDVAALADARQLFTEVVDERLARLPESERALERTRLLGSIAGAGLGERTFRFEAARPTPVVERLLELALDGRYDAAGREVRLRGTADRIDLLADGTLRLLDYKTGKASNAREALQVPVYAFCAERHLAGHAGRTWTVNEAGYLAFGRAEPYVSVVTADSRARKLEEAAAQLAATVERIERGEFPVAPEEPHLCMYCGFSSVCRKDYVEEE